jgi:hypothetical protein
MDLDWRDLSDELVYPKVEVLYGSEKSTQWKLIGHPMVTDYATLSDVIVDEQVYILKFIPYAITERDAILGEIDLQHESSLIGVSPAILEAWLSDHGGVIVMEKLGAHASDLLLHYASLGVKQLILANIMTLIGKLHLHKIYHGDTHFGNILVVAEGEASSSFKRNPQRPLRDVTVDGGEEFVDYVRKGYRFYLIDFGEGGRLSGQTDDIQKIKQDYSGLEMGLYDLLTENYTPSLRNVYDTLTVFLRRFDD